MSREAVMRRSRDVLSSPEYDDVERVRVVVVDFPVLLAECKTSGLDVLLTSADENVTYVFAAMDAPCDVIRQRIVDSWKE